MQRWARLRYALFVDFDNVYIGLQRLDPSAAEAFANAPTHWLTALETGNDAEGEFSRRFLIRSCYLNPSVFSQFRPNFTRAGFSVVDCPSLTQQGKSSADINLVLDAVDALSAETRYDEFVILSADADFTPLALRCRAADRRVTIITAGPASNSPARRAVLRLVRSADRPLAGSMVAQAALKADPSLSSSGWEGAGAFFPWLAKAFHELGAASRPAPGFVWDPKRLSEADLPSAGAVDLPPLQRQVVDVTDIPNLPVEHYQILLTSLTDDVRAAPFVRTETSKRVRDACQAVGAKIGRASVNTVITGVLYAGLDLTAKPSAKKVAETWAENVIGLCRGARMELGPKDVAAIRAWVGGGLLQKYVGASQRCCVAAPRHD
ncbi:MAG: NYN domain-containing protein [Actinomycetota bacterium]